MSACKPIKLRAEDVERRSLKPIKITHATAPGQPRATKEMMLQEHSSAWNAKRNIVTLGRDTARAFAKHANWHVGETKRVTCERTLTTCWRLPRLSQNVRIDKFIFRKQATYNLLHGSDKTFPKPKNSYFLLTAPVIDGVNRTRQKYQLKRLSHHARAGKSLSLLSSWDMQNFSRLQSLWPFLYQ